MAIPRFRWTGAGWVTSPMRTLPAICSVEAWVKAEPPVTDGFIWTNRGNSAIGGFGNVFLSLDGGRPVFGDALTG